MDLFNGDLDIHKILNNDSKWKNKRKNYIRIIFYFNQVIKNILTGFFKSMF